MFARHAWAVLFAIGFLLIGWGAHQIVNIPRVDPDHWSWLTSDLEVVEYAKFWFRIHGVWTLANGLFIAFVALTAFRQGERWAWLTLTYVPIHILLLTTRFYWLFFIGIPLIVLSGAALWVGQRPRRGPASSRPNPGWLFFVLIGLGLLYFAYDNFAVIPALDARDPDRGWSWLTTEPSIVQYIKFYFQIFGLRVLAFALLTILTAVTGLRKGSREAWLVLWILPLLVGVHFFFMPWIAPVLIGVILAAVLGLWWSAPKAGNPERS